MYSNAQYVLGLDGEISGIRVDINGVSSFVPIDPNNTDYKNMMELVEQGKLVIAPAD